MSRPHHFSAIPWVRLVVMCVFVSTAVAEESPAARKRSRQIYSSHVQIHRVDPGVSVPKEQALPELELPDLSGNADSGALDGYDTGPAAPHPSPRVHRERKPDNWIVPAGISDTQDADKERPSTSWGWLADEAEAAKVRDEEKATQDDENAKDEDDLFAPRSLKLTDKDPLEVEPVTFESVFERVEPADPGDNQKPRAEGESVEPTPRPEDSAFTTPLASPEDILSPGYGSPELESYFGTEPTAARYDREQALPQTEAILAGITQPLTESMRPQMNPSLPAAAEPRDVARGFQQSSGAQFEEALFPRLLSGRIEGESTAVPGELSGSVFGREQGFDSGRSGFGFQPDYSQGSAGEAGSSRALLPTQPLSADKPLE